MVVDINNRFFLIKKKGGLNPCIEGNNKHGLRPYSGCVLPNCVGAAVALFNMLNDVPSCKYLGNTDAKNFVKYPEKQGLRTGSEPVKNACMVWGGTGKGHVAIVKEVIDESHVLTYESGWNYLKGPVLREKKRGGKNWGENKPFIYFIYPPGYIPQTKIFYKVAKGDTLSAIAKRYNTTVAAIQRLNPDLIKNVNLIKTGWTIRVK